MVRSSFSGVELNLMTARRLIEQVHGVAGRIDADLLRRIEGSAEFGGTRREMQPAGLGGTGNVCRRL